MLKKGFMLLTLFGLAFVLLGCSNDGEAENGNNEEEEIVELESDEAEVETEPEETVSIEWVDLTDVPVSEERPSVEFDIEDHGLIVIELFPEYAPITVENFLNLVEEGFYDGLTFHRIIPGFMIQGGCTEGTGMGGSDENIVGEFLANGIANPILHTRGVLSMARLGHDPNSASSQFFIMHADASFLDADYAAFGRVIHGMEVVDSIVDSVTPDANGAFAEDQPVIREARIIN